MFDIVEDKLERPFINAEVPDAVATIHPSSHARPTKGSGPEVAHVAARDRTRSAMADAGPRAGGNDCRRRRIEQVAAADRRRHRVPAWRDRPNGNGYPRTVQDHGP